MIRLSSPETAGKAIIEALTQYSCHSAHTLKTCLYMLLALSTSFVVDSHRMRTFAGIFLAQACWQLAAHSCSNLIFIYEVHVQIDKEDWSTHSLLKDCCFQTHTRCIRSWNRSLFVEVYLRAFSFWVRQNRKCLWCCNPHGPFWTAHLASHNYIGIHTYIHMYRLCNIHLIHINVYTYIRMCIYKNA